MVVLVVVVVAWLSVDCQWGSLLTLRPVAGCYGMRSLLGSTDPAGAMQSMGETLLAWLLPPRCRGEPRLAQRPWMSIPRTTVQASDS